MDKHVNLLSVSDMLQILFGEAAGLTPQQYVVVS